MSIFFKKLDSLFFVLGFILLTIIGFLQKSTIVIFADYSCLKIFFVVLVATGFIQYFIRLNFFIFNILSILLISFLTGFFDCLFIALFFCLSSYKLGLFIIEYLEISNDEFSTELSIAIGLGFYGTLLSILAHFKINYTYTYGLLLLAPYFYNLVPFINKIQKKFLGLAFNREKEFSFFNVTISAFIIFYLLCALMPEYLWDSIFMHLFIPAQIKGLHFWSFNQQFYFFALMPIMADMLYSMTYMFGDEYAVKLLVYLISLFLVFLVYKTILNINSNKQAAKLGSLLLLSTPLFFLECTSVMVENLLSVFFLLVMICFRLLNVREENIKYMLIIGILIGFSFETKALTLFYVMAITPLFFISFIKFSNKKLWLTYFFYSIFLLIIIGGIPYFNSYFFSKNPIYPFYNAFFKASFYPPENFQDARWFKDISVDFLYKIIFQSDSYMESNAGAPGFYLLALFPFSVYLMVRNRNFKNAYMLLVVIIYTLLCIHFTHYLRYLYVIFPLAIVYVNSFFNPADLKENLEYKSFYLLNILAIIMGTILINASSHGYRWVPINFLIDKQNKLLVERRTSFAMSDVINMLNLDNRPIMCIGIGYMKNISTDILLYNSYNITFTNEINNIKTTDDFKNLIKKYGVIYITLTDDVDPKIKRIVENSTLFLLKINNMSLRKFEY